MTLPPTRLWLALAAISVSHAAAAQSRYDPLQTFAPLTLPEPVNRYRSADGAPGPDYWQNRADYEIHARLDHGANAAEAERGHYLHQ